jgi:hypothetical protein
VVLTCIFWALFFLPGYAWLRRFWPAPREAGLLYTLAFGYAASFLCLSPVSLVCYLLRTPLYVFSGACVLASALALAWLLRERAFRELWTLTKAESPLPWLLLACLLWLQARSGGWLDGDATFHLGRMRVLLQHGFSNRDIYLAEDYFQSVYHTNLLFPVYASIAQLTHQSYLDSWFYTEPWAKLMVAAGHYVFAYALTRQRFAAYLLALIAITANAGETYALYPNTLCVGFLLPMLLGVGFAFAARIDTRQRVLGQLAALDFLLGEVHALYAVYAALVLAPVLVVALLFGRARRERVLCVVALACLAGAAPFVLVSAYAARSDRPIATAPEEDEAASNSRPPPRPPGLVDQQSHVPEPLALAAGGGHLEKVMDPIDLEHVVFNPQRMGGLTFVVCGFLALCLALILRRGQRLAISVVLFAALLLAAVLFTVRGASAALQLLRTPFVVARLSTVLAMLLFFGIAACVAACTQLLGRTRVIVEAVLTLAMVFLATQLLGHAPLSFADHLRDALAPLAQRHALLDQLETRRALLERTLPRGVTVLTTARFARQLVMLCDCYVLAADRGHTGVQGIGKRRRDLVVLNAATTPWEVRAKLMASYGLKLVAFEQRWARRYRWTFEHGHVIGNAAGLDVMQIDR